MSSEFDEKHRLFAAQPEQLQRSLFVQAEILGKALILGLRSVYFTLPAEVMIPEGEHGPCRLLAVPKRFRRQRVGGLADRLVRRDLFTLIRKQFQELEGSPDLAVSASAALLRHAFALHLLHRLIPNGRPVKYIAAGGEAIPSIPVGGDEDRASDGQEPPICPPAARRFYLPQWVAFDDQGRLLVESVEEAESRVARTQRCMAVLQMAAQLALYIVADEVYQEKHCGLLGQLVNQGRALARYQTRLIIERIRQLAAQNRLNRGMSLSLPYFDDLDLALKMYDFEVIPKGRVLFVPAFVVCAVREVEERVAQDARMSASTRNHLLAELRTLERAFESPGGSTGSGRRIKIKEPALRQAETNFLIDPST